MTARTAGKGAVGLLALLTLLNTLNFVDRQLLISFANFIVPELRLSNVQFAILTGPAFILFYAVAGVFMGMIADTVDRARLISGAVGLWSLLTAASGLATGFVGLAIPRSLIGVGEAALTPSALAMLGDRFPGPRLGLVSGVYYAGVPLGAGASLLLAGLAGPLIGWRVCFLILGALGLAMAVIFLFVRDVRVRPGQTRPESIGRTVTSFSRALAASRPLQCVFGAGILLHLLIGSSIFDQLWLVRERGFDRASIAIAVGVITAVAGLAGNLFGGVFSDYWRRRTGQSRLLLLFWTLLLLSPLVIGVRLAPAGGLLFWAGVTAAAFQLGAMYAPLFSTIQELSPPQARSTALACAIFAMNVFGIGLGAVANGYAIDQLTKAGAAQPYTTVALVNVLLSLLAIPLLWLAARPGCTQAGPATP